MKTAKKNVSLEIPAEEIRPIKMRTISIMLVGMTPLIMHRYAQKAWQELVYPSGRKNAAERAGTMKHDPIAEYRECFYRNRDEKAPTLFHLPDGMVTASLATAALRVPGATKTEIISLTSIAEQIDLYGVPKLGMAMVRTGGMTRTPDVRTRAYFPQWACVVTLRYKTDPLTDNQMVNLLGAAGEIVGFGDWRQQKGGRYGRFRIASANDAEFKDIVAKQRRAAQQSAYDKPEAFDIDTEDLLAWFTAEVKRRRQAPDQKAQGKKPQSPNNVAAIEVVQ